MIALGKQARDIVTGFKGTITGRAEYITGCSQYLLMPKAKDDGALADGHWFDEQRLQVEEGAPLTFNNEKTPGPDLEAPKR